MPEANGAAHTRRLLDEVSITDIQARERRTEELH